MRVLVQTLVEISLFMAVVIAALLLLRPLFQKRLRAKWAYWAWLAVTVRLLIPFNAAPPQTPVVIYIPQPGFSVDLPVAFTPPANPDVLPAPTDPLPVTASVVMDGWTVTALIWGLGVVLALILNITPYFRFRRQVRRWSTPVDEPEVDALRQDLGAGGLRLARCSAIRVPMVSGFLRPTLLVPEGALPEEPILRHEIIHYKRRDLWYKLLLMAASCVHWFNPLVWLMARAANRDLERACDEAVTAGREEAYRADYGRAILDAVDTSYGNRAPLTTYFHGGKRAMLERLASILSTEGKKRGAAALALVLVTVLLGAGVVSATVFTPSVEHPETLSRSPRRDVTLSYVTGDDGYSLWTMHRRGVSIGTARTPGVFVWQKALWSPDGKWAAVRTGGDGLSLLYETDGGVEVRALRWDKGVIAYTPIEWVGDDRLRFSYVRESAAQGLIGGTACYEPSSNTVVNVTEEAECVMMQESPPELSRMPYWALPLPVGTELVRDSDSGAEWMLDGKSIGMVRKEALKPNEKNGTIGLQSVHVTGEQTYLESAYPIGDTGWAWRLRLDIDLLRQDLAQAMVERFWVNGAPAYAAVLEPKVTLEPSQLRFAQMPEDVVMTWRNECAADIMFGRFYGLERMGAVDWEAVEPAVDMAFYSDGFSLKPGGSWPMSYTLRERYGELPEGEYRIQADYTVEWPLDSSQSRERDTVYGRFQIGTGETADKGAER